MIIKLIAETEAEKKNEAEITNVKEYFFAGHNTNEDGDNNEFHQWQGSHRYLLGTLRYFVDVISDDRKDSREEGKRREQMRRNLQSQVTPQLNFIDNDDIPTVNDTDTPTIVEEEIVKE
jgi:hypothetical protein